MDGTNGDTILKPVNGTLGSTNFTTSGGILKHDADLRRTISLDVSMPAGNLRDILTLAMKGAPFMQGKIFLKTTIDIPPLTGKVREKLLLDGQFEISQGKFLRSTIQNQIDSLSRRGQGQPENEEIDEVVSVMAGKFKLENEVITFRSLSFAVPGSGVDLAGSYDLGSGRPGFSWHAETRGQSVRDHDRLEAMGVETRRPVLFQARFGNAPAHPGCGDLEGADNSGVTAATRIRRNRGKGEE